MMRTLKMCMGIQSQQKTKTIMNSNKNLSAVGGTEDIGKQCDSWEPERERGSIYESREGLNTDFKWKRFKQIVVLMRELKVVQSNIHDDKINLELKTKVRGNDKLVLKLFRHKCRSVEYRREISADIKLWRILLIAKRHSLQNEAEVAIGEASEQFSSYMEWQSI